ncbi:MAG: type V CRISPR-associated protein Cas4 [Balneolaceae bacterium]
MEPYIPISFLNDFIFCPRSIYFHQLYKAYHTALYQEKPQIAGKEAHTAIDKGTYSTRKTVLQGMDIYSDTYNLCGKIDVFDTSTGVLTERKREIKTIYDGYVFQVYAHYHALTEMGYKVTSIVLHDLTHNKNHPIPLPSDDPVMQGKFETLVDQLNSFDLNAKDFTPIEAKCQNCIYSNLCDYSLC